MDKTLLVLLMNAIKAKGQISDLDDIFIQKRLEVFMLLRGDLRKKLVNRYEEKGMANIEKDKTFKEIVKSIREEIGIVYGSFLTSSFPRKEKLLADTNTLDELHNLLPLHKSSRERSNYYNEVYSKIFAWYKPTSGIADLACGMNPLSYGIMTKVLGNNLFYLAVDLNPADMTFIEDVFEKFDIDGKSVASDISNLDVLKEPALKKCDLVFLFKALDSLETLNRDVSEKLLKGLDAKKLVVSFPTKSLVAQKTMRSKRTWFYKIIQKYNWRYQEFEVGGELYILIEK